MASLNPIKQLAGQTVIYGLSSIVPKFLSYILVPLYAHFFSPAEYGVVGDLYSLAVILNIIVTYGMETAFFWFNKNEKSNPAVFSTSFISIFTTSTIFVVLAIVFSHSIASALDYANHSEYIVWFAIIIGVDAITAIPFVKLRQENKAFRFAFIKMGSVLLNVFLNVLYLVVFPYLISKGFHFHKMVYNPEIGVGYAFIANVISSIATLIFMLQDIRLKISVDFVLLKRMLKYALPLLFAGLAGGINDAIDRQFIKYFSPEGTIPLEQLGIYFANVKIAVILMVFIQTFRFAAEPFFFNYEKEKDSKQVFADIMKYFAIFCFVIMLGTMANLDVFKYFLDTPYWSGLFILPIVLLSNVFVGLYLNLSVWYKLSGKTLYAVYIIAIGAGITILLNFLFVHTYGYVASAYARLVCYVIMVFICFFLGQKYYKIPYDVKSIARYFLITMVLFFAIVFFGNINVYLRIVIFNLAILLFIYYALKREKLLPVVLKLLKLK